MNDEFNLIHEYFAPLAASAPGARGLLDDAAVIAPRHGNELVVTMDTVVEGVHYLKQETPDNIVAKLMGSNLSDLAAMGATPHGFTLSCGWSNDVTQAQIKAFSDALKDWVERFSFPLLGGDTVKTAGGGVFSVTAFGEVSSGSAIGRDGAGVGDNVYVTGTIGDGALGLLAAQNELRGISKIHESFLADRYRVPQPRINIGMSLIGRATACIDISDGLVQDLNHIAQTSGVRLEIETGTIPLSKAANSVIESDPDMRSVILTGGDDYELAFTSRQPPEAGDIPITKIGRVIAGEPGVMIVDETGEAVSFEKSGFNHFSH